MITRPMPHGQPACKAAASSAAKGARVDGVAGNCTTRGWPSINALLLAGDVSDDLTILEQTLKDCVAAFDHVFFVPGNHCLWVRSTSQQTGITDSLQKLIAVVETCRRLGVHTTPQRLGPLVIAPLLSWHHASWDREPDVASARRFPVADYEACVWPAGVPGEAGGDALAAWFDALNGPLVQSTLGGDVITMSHFLPLQELMPEKRFLFFPMLAKISGSAYLAARLQHWKPHMHVFGHTHFSWDACIDGTRFIQAPLCYPSERRRRRKSLSFAPQQPSQQGALVQEDPDDAAWLPVELYAAWVPHGTAVQDAVPCNGTGQLLSRLHATNASAHQSPLSVLPAHNTVAAADSAAHDEPQPLLTPPTSLPTPLRSAPAPGSPAVPTCAAGVDAYAAARGMVASQGGGYWSPPLQGYWSSYYAAHAREPDNTEPAPWVNMRRRRAAQT